MIVQNPLVPPLPPVSGNTPSPVSNAPTTAQTDQPETARPVTQPEEPERSAAEDRGRTEADSRGAERDRGQEVDIEA